MMRQYFALTLFELKQHLSDRVGLFWTFLFPVLLLFLLVSFYDRADETAAFVNEFTLCGDEEEVFPVARELLDILGSSVSILRVAHTSGVDSGYLYVADSGCEKTEGIERGISRFFSNDELDKDVLAAVNGATKRTAMEAQTTVANLTNQLDSPTEYISSGLVAMTLMSVCLFGVCLWIVQMRSKGVFRRYVLYPVPQWMVVSAFIASRALGMLIYVVAFSVLTIYATGISIATDNLPELFLFLTLGILCFISVGVQLSCTLTSTAAASGVVSILNFFLSFVSDLYISDSFLPTLAQNVVSYLPLNAFVEGLRILAFESDQDGVAFPVLVIIFWLVVSFSYSQRYFRWQ